MFGVDSKCFVSVVVSIEVVLCVFVFISLCIWGVLYMFRCAFWCVFRDVFNGVCVCSGCV